MILFLKFAGYDQGKIGHCRTNIIIYPYGDKMVLGTLCNVPQVK